MRLFIPLSLALSFAAACGPPSTPPVALNSEDDKIIYSLGVGMGQAVTALDLSERELEIVKRGLEDQAFGRKPAVELAEMEKYAARFNEFAKIRNARVAQQERKAAEAFLADAAAAPGAVKTDSGLIYTETKAGSGASPSATDRVKVHYHGTLRDGAVFDSSRDRGEPVVFPVNGVIPCWTEALQMMKVGGQATIVCPPDTAYGDLGTGRIKPGATLRFEVELISIE